MFMRSRNAVAGLLTTLAFALHSLPSHADILRAAQFDALIAGGSGRFNQVFRQNEAFAFTLSPGFVSTNPDGGGGGFDVTASFSDGPSPSASISGYGFPPVCCPGSPINQASAELNYYVRIYLDPDYSEALFETPIPVSVTGVLRTSVEALPTVGRPGGFAAANVWITGPGINFAQGSQSSFNSPSDPLADTQTFAHSVSLFAGGSAVNVRLLARGNAANVAFSAFADPVFRIDPDATFDFNGETIRFVDAAGLEYSPGISAVPLPTALGLFGSAIGFLAVRGRRRFARRV